MTEFRMPSLGADMAAGTLREWRKKPGDPIRRGDIIAEVETQKGIIEVEVFTEGVMGKQLLETDKKVPVGTPMAEILTQAEWLALNPAEPKGPAIAPAALPALAPVHLVRISPLARRVANSKGIDVTQLTGSGPEGAIVLKDVESFNPSEKPKVVSGMREAVAAAMSRSKREIPHYYLQSTADLAVMSDFLSEKNRNLPPENRILPAAVFLRVVALALKECPDLNGWWKDDRFIRADAVNVGFAISLKSGGLVNPAIRNADQVKLDEIMTQLSDMIARARGGVLKSGELSDGTFTLSSIGAHGADALFGIIHPPQVGLAGFGPVRETVMAINGMVAVRPGMTMTLSADHRATDGIYGSKFMHSVSRYLQQPETW